MPLITYTELSYSTEEKYVHELVHSIKSQFSLSLLDEVYAFKIQNRVNDTNEFSALKTGVIYGTSYMILGYNTPLFAASCLLSPLFLCAPLSIVPLTAYCFYKTNKKFEKFVKKCKSEKLNPYYLLLRSDLSEYELNRPIRDQLKTKKGLRWDIIRLRMERDF